MNIACRVLSFVLILIFNSGAFADSAYKPSGVVTAENTYILAPHPNLNPQDLYTAYEPVARYLERKIPGVRFSIETSRDYPDYEAKIAARHFHFGIPNPFQTTLSLEHGYRVIAKMTPDEVFRGLMVARKDSKLRSPSELAGKPLCFISPSAVAATMLPLLYLHEHGLNVTENQVKYVGSPFSAIMNVYTGNSLACGVSVRQWRAWKRDNADKARQMDTLWMTRSLPNNGVIARDDVPVELAQKVAAALAGMDRDKTLDQKQFKFNQNHYAHADAKTYKPFLDFLKRYDQKIGLPPSMKLRNPR
ncbi:MAG: phosphate/phosphite/phosphonate ABC transporter substrate-binding protein [Betaproteobacteria bacterium]|nr:phosphate/phosphite/phosphonate ABC transporter substrate-binding protein [Betaproteobacteria bacterium]